MMTPQHAKIMSQPNNAPWVSMSFHCTWLHCKSSRSLPVSWRFHRSWGVNNRKAHVHWEALGCMSAKHQKSSVQIIFTHILKREAQRSASAHAAMAEARHTTPTASPAICASNGGKSFGDFTVPSPSTRRLAFWTCHIGGSPLLQSWLENDPHWPKFVKDRSHFPLNHNCLRKNTLVNLNTILDHLQGLKKQKLWKMSTIQSQCYIQVSEWPIHWLLWW